MGGGLGQLKGEIALFGDLRVTLDGREVDRDFPGRQGRLAFAFLASRHPEAVRREELIELLWPGPVTDAARNSLNAILSKLKRALGPEMLEGRDPLRLVLPQGVTVDVARCSECVSSAQAELASGRPQPALAAARVALGAMEETFLDGLDGPWVKERRRELEELRLQALEAAGRAALTLNELETLEQCARTLVATSPFRESGHRLLLEALARSGRTEEAIAVYDELETRLEEELGTEPAPETRALRERLDGHPGTVSVQAPERVAMPPVLREALGDSFVGREALLGALSEAWETVLDSGARLVAMTGEAGVGKTHLVAAFAQARHDEDALVLYGRCEQSGGGAFEPFAQALRPLAAGAAIVRLGPLAAELMRIQPGAAGAVDVPSQPADGTDRYRLFTAVEELLAASAVEQPLLMIVDDLHWADQPTLALLRHLARAARPGPLMILAVFRDSDSAPGDPLNRLIGDLRRDGLAERLHVDGLSENEVAALMSRRFGRAPDPDAVARLRERTGGNAFFLGELVRAASDGAGSRIDPFAALEGLGAPDGVKALISQRLRELPEEVGHVLGAASTVGVAADLGVLEGYPDLAAYDVLSALETAASAGLAIEQPGSPGRFAFVHALVRDALYETLDGEQRARLHAQAADALYLAGASPAEVARHMLAAGEHVPVERTIGMLRRAGDRARGQAAYEDAARHFDAALALAEHLDRPDAELCDLLLATGEALQCSGEVAEAREDFVRAAELARRAEDPERLAAAALGVRGPYGETSVVDQEAIDLLEAALAGLSDRPGPLRAVVAAGLARSLYWTGDLERVDALSAEAMREAEEIGDASVLAAAWSARHDVLRHPRHLDERRRLVEGVLERAVELADRELTAQAHQIRGVDYLEAGDRQGAEADFAAVERLARELRQPLFERYAAMWQVMRAHMDGRLEDAERLAHDTLAVALRSGARDAAQAFGVQLFAILRYRGGVEGLRPMLAAIVEEFPHVPAWRAGLALVSSDAGDADAARAELATLASFGLSSLPEDAGWILGTTMAAEAAFELSESSIAAELLDLLAPYTDRVILARGAICFGPVARPVALLHAALGDVDAALDCFECAMDVAGALAAPAFAVHAACDRARVLARAGREGAAGELRAAVEAAQSTGLHRLATICEAELDRLG